MKARLLGLVPAIFAVCIYCSAEDSPPVARPSAGTKVATTTNQPATNSLSTIRIKSAVGGIEDLGFQTTLTAGGYKLRFHVPTGWVVRDQGGGQGYQLSHKSSAGKISLMLNIDASKQLTNYTHELLRPRALSQYKDARIVAEYPTAALGTNNALVFDLALPLQASPWTGRLVYIPCQAGEIQVFLVVPKEQSAGIVNVMMSIISSMEVRKSNEDFQIVPTNQGL